MLDQLIKDTDSQILLKKRELNAKRFENEVKSYERNGMYLRKDARRKYSKKALLKKIGRDVKEIIEAL